jgi:hypothetical protein
MNTTSRAILQTVLTTDASLSGAERGTVQRLIDGQADGPATESGTGAPLLLTQKATANLLSVSRVTIWRMTKDCVLHPVEILPGTLRYPYREITALAREGLRTGVEIGN